MQTSVLQVPRVPQLIDVLSAAKREMADTVASFLPCSAVLPLICGFPESDTLRRLWPLATFTLFLVSLGDSAFRFMLAVEVQVEPSEEHEKVLSLLVMFT